MISMQRVTASGACSAVFSTTVFPATSAGPSLTAVRKSGAFHGMIAADHAQRLARRVAELARLPWQRPALQLGAEPAEQPQHLEHRRDLGSRLRGERVAGLEAEEPREALAFLLERIGDPAQWSPRVLAGSFAQRGQASWAVSTAHATSSSRHRGAYPMPVLVGRILDRERFGGARRAEDPADHDLARQPLRFGVGVHHARRMRPAGLEVCRVLHARSLPVIARDGNPRRAAPDPRPSLQS